MIDARAHRLDRHGQVDGRPMFEQAGIPVFDADCGSSPLAVRGSGADRSDRPALPGDGRGRQARSRSACRACARAARRHSRRSRRSSIRPCTPRERGSFSTIARRRRCCSTFPCCSRLQARRQFDKLIVVSAPADVQRARVLGTTGHDGRQARCHPRSSDARRGEARARRFRHRHRRRSIHNRRPGGGDSRLSRTRPGEITRRCARSSSTPRPPASARLPATAWSRSAASKSSTASRPAGTSTLTSIPTGRCRRKPKPCMASARSSSPTSRCFHELVEELLEFIEDSPLVAHNAGFDFGFLNHELERCGRPASARAAWSTR